MEMMSKIYVMLLTVLFSLNSVYAQNDFYLILIGKVKAEETSLPLKNALVKVITYHGDTVDHNTDDTGNIEIKLAAENVYLVTFSYPEYVSKSLEFSTENILEDYKALGNEEFQFGLSLFKEVEGLDVSIFENPMARIEMSEDQSGFVYNNKYSNSIKSEVQKVMEERTKLINSTEDH